MLSSSKHIVIFVRSLPLHASFGGMETQAHLLAEGLLEEGHKVDVITNPAFKSVPSTKYKIHFTSKGDHTKYTKEYFSQSANILKEIHERDPVDMVISESAAGFGYSLKRKVELGIPVILIQHGSLWGEVQTTQAKATSFKDYLRLILKIYPYAFKTYFMLDLKHMKKVDQIIAVSQSVKEAVVKEYRVDASKVSVVYNGIEVNKFQVASEEEKMNLRNNLGIAPKDLVLLYVGRVIAEKGLQDVVQVLPQLPTSVKFMVVGAGDFLSTLKAKISKQGLEERVSFMGRVGYEEVAKYYKVADVFVFPTHREEGFPMTLIEAQASGLPVIVADKGGAKEAIEEEVTGWSYPAGDLKQLTLTLQQAVNNADLKTMSREAESRAVKLFSQRKMVMDTLAVMAKVLEKPTT